MEIFNSFLLNAISHDKTPEDKTITLKSKIRPNFIIMIYDYVLSKMELCYVLFRLFEDALLIHGSL